jgi:MoxR-like ATPase
LLLEVLSDWQISIPEMGTVRADVIPLVFLTSNNERELSEALKRRCLYLFLDYPPAEREKAIVLERVPEVEPALAERLVAIVSSIRALELKKAPSIAETLDWARTLVTLGISELDERALRSTLPVLLKFQTDLGKAAEHLKLPAG